MNKYKHRKKKKHWHILGLWACLFIQRKMKMKEHGGSHNLPFRKEYLFQTPALFRRVWDQMCNAKNTHRVVENPLFWTTSGIKLQMNFQKQGRTAVSMEVELHEIFMSMKESTAKHSFFWQVTKRKFTCDKQIQVLHKIIFPVTWVVRIKHLDRAQAVKSCGNISQPSALSYL